MISNVSRVELKYHMNPQEVYLLKERLNHFMQKDL